MNVVEKYAFNDKIKAVLINASSSAHTGFEFAEYSASKAGLLGYTKNVAWRLAKEYKAICNSISFTVKQKCIKTSPIFIVQINFRSS